MDSDDALSNTEDWLPSRISQIEIGNSYEEEPKPVSENSEIKEGNEKILRFGIQESGDDLILPNEDLTAKIIQRVEFLFSDCNVYKDNFLLKHIRRNKHGYVSLKLIASSRKIKALTKDWRVVAHSLLGSKKLQMNEEMTKVRRCDPLPDTAILSPFSKVLVFKMPPDVRTAEDVKNLLKGFGKVIEATIISSANTASPSIRQRMASYRSMCTSTYAIAEFESPEAALNATKQHSKFSFIVVPLSENDRDCKKPRSPLPSPKYQRCRTSRWDSRGKLSSPDDTNSSDEMHQIPSSSELVAEHSTSRKAHHHQKKPVHPNSESDLQEGQRKLQNQHRENRGMNGSWKQRREMSCNLEKNSVIIIREPIGPDGTMGFHAGRAKAHLKIH